MSDLNDYTAAPAAPSGTPNAEERQWGMLAHLLAFCGVVIPLGNVIAPLVVWQIKKDTMPFVSDQAKEALNFNITMAIAVIICIVLSFVLIGLILGPLVGIAWLVLTIIAGLKANEGIAYRYPFALRLIK